MELISGNEGEKGETCKLVYKKLDLIETILPNNLPDEFYAKYEHKHMVNTIRSTFTIIDENKTNLETEIEYLEFRGFVVKLFAKVFPSMFKKQVDK